MRKILVALVLASTTVACTPAPAPAAMPVAADNGQPKMQATLDALQKAKAEATAAEENKGGHRANAIKLIDEAIEDVNQGMQYAAAHASEAGAEEGAAEAEPVDEEVKGAGGQPHMASAVVELREARKQLKEAKHDKGGFRKKGLQAINEAIKQLHEGIKFADEHHG